MTSNVENAFAYNVLMPDVILFTVGITSAFGILLLIL